ncbi:acetate/propionate family kinase [Eudoraea sp.]|uniref:acetate/propionate family kinase n=1 Tax=Eudoraea sp. TaxID=1979955 RepID=UPI003C74FA4F
MLILILNSGSSSIKFQLMQMPDEKILSSGLIERIGAENSKFKYQNDSAMIDEERQVETHLAGLEMIAKLLLDPVKGNISKAEEIYAIGHRVVHGGNSFRDTTLITPEVKETIKKLNVLAPLHNPHNLAGIEVAENLFPKAKQVAVFDTAFHQTIPTKARKYGIPNAFFEEKRIQLYGFHGTSHKYVTQRTNQYFGEIIENVISIHLGNGCSITAVKNGNSIDHSLGFAPSNGLIMGTRSGDIDHSIIFYMVRTLGYELDEVEKLLNSKSGMLGLSGYSDLRDIQMAALEGDAHCLMALEMNAYRIKKYIGSYTAILNGLDTLIFTAGIGENSSMLREMICSDLTFLGIVLDTRKNDLNNSGIREIQSDSSKVKILVVPTNEELEIAKQGYELLKED